MSTTTASPADQVRLLELQRLDTALDRARRRMQQLRTDPELATLQQALAERRETAAATATALEQATAAVRQAEATVTEVRDRRDRTQRRLDAGQGSAKDLEGMLHELSTLSALQDEHEGTELEAMEVAERAEAEDTVARQALTEAQEAVRQRGAVLTEEAATVAAEGNDLTGRRASFAAGLPADLVARYERIRERTGGIAAARLVGNTSEASGMPLSPADLAQIDQAAPDELVFCPDSGAILVRDAPETSGKEEE